MMFEHLSLSVATALGRISYQFAPVEKLGYHGELVSNLHIFSWTTHKTVAVWMLIAHCASHCCDQVDWGRAPTVCGQVCLTSKMGHRCGEAARLVMSHCLLVLPVAFISSGQVLVRGDLDHVVDQKCNVSATFIRAQMGTC